MKKTTTTFLLMVFLSAIYLSACKSEAQKKIEADQLQQIEKAKQDSINKAYNDKIESYNLELKAERSMLEDLGCSFDELKQAFSLSDSARTDLVKSYTKTKKIIGKKDFSVQEATFIDSLIVSDEFAYQKSLKK